MFITNKDELLKFTPELRTWIGIPGLEITKNGRMFFTYYSGEKGETIGNYIILSVSVDNGKTFNDPIAVAYQKECRCFDPCLWIDPLGRLWLFWAVQPVAKTYCVRCDNPDADELIWSEVKYIGDGVMMNKPTVLSTGEWLFPISVWQSPCIGRWDRSCARDTEGAFVYISTDNGETVTRLGAARTPKNYATFDEHMVLELNDGRLMMLIRTTYGIGVSYSWNRGKTWSDVLPSDILGPGSRFFIRRLLSGRVLLINHYEFDGRNNLTAMLSEDDCKTWKYKLLLDERSNVSYPDATQKDGYIYITYDRERGGSLKSVSDAYSAAREILWAKITEDDIMAGKLVSQESSLKNIASKLGLFRVGTPNPYDEISSYTPKQVADMLFYKYNKNNITYRIFEMYSPKCINMNIEDAVKLDMMINEFENPGSEDFQTITDIISLITKYEDTEIDVSLIPHRIKEQLEQCDGKISDADIAKSLSLSHKYMLYLFKKITGITLEEYKNVMMK